MMLITKEIQEAFDRQGDTSQKSMADIKVICKLFNPVGAGTWYLYEQETERIYMGFVNLVGAEFSECGSVDMEELKSLQLPMGLRIERDRHFPIGKYTLKEIVDKVQSGVHV